VVWTVYLSGEIHSDWRHQIQSGCSEAGLDIVFTGPVTDHGASDDAGDVVGDEEQGFWKDHKSANINAIRIQKSIGEADLVVVRFGDKYKQWNAAFDAGYAAALGVPYITLHGADIVHALKEVDAGAKAWAQSPSQIVEILSYLINQK